MAREISLIYIWCFRRKFTETATSKTAYINVKINRSRREMYVVSKINSFSTLIYLYFIFMYSIDSKDDVKKLHLHIYHVFFVFSKNIKWWLICCWIFACSGVYKAKIKEIHQIIKDKQSTPEPSKTPPVAV